MLQTAAEHERERACETKKLVRPKPVTWYPGGKYYATPFLWRWVPRDIREYREPFVGGGSMFLTVRANLPHVKCWINDIDSELIALYRAIQTDPHRLIARIEQIRSDCIRNSLTAREVEQLLKSEYGQGDTIQRGARYYVLNRISYGGIVGWGASKSNYHEFLTRNHHLRLLELSSLLTSVRITEGDYEPPLHEAGERVLIYLDPPYSTGSDLKMYGENGKYHKHFDHIRLASSLAECYHRWFMTYDDSPFVRELYKQYPNTLRTAEYIMAIYRSGAKAKQVSELVIHSGYSLGTNILQTSFAL